MARPIACVHHPKLNGFTFIFHSFLDGDRVLCFESRQIFFFEKERWNLNFLKTDLDSWELQDSKNIYIIYAFQTYFFWNFFRRTVHELWVSECSMSAILNWWENCCHFLPKKVPNVQHKMPLIKESTHVVHFAELCYYKLTSTSHSTCSKRCRW